MTIQVSVVENQNLTATSNEKAIYHLVLQAEQVLDYQVGDWALVFPKNSPGLVDLIQQSLVLNGTEIIELRRVGQVAVQEALSQHLELTQLNPAILNKLQRHFNWSIWADRQAMMDYAQNKDILDLLQAFPELSQLGIEFLTFLSPLAPRYYSIASSPKVSPNRLALVYEQVVYSMAGRQRFGVATNQLAALQQGDMLHIELAANRAFKLPDSAGTPVIMVGAGTGIAPFIGFLAERAQQAATHNWLFFGERYQATNFLFEADLQGYVDQGRLQLTTAFSRDQAEKHYVQDRLLEHRVAVWQWLRQGACLYICGDKAGMAKAVEQTVKRMMAEAGLNAEQTWLDWKQSGQVQMDVF